MDVLAALGDGATAVIAVVAILVGVVLVARGQRDEPGAELDVDAPSGPSLLTVPVAGTAPDPDPPAEDDGLRRMPVGEVGHGPIRLGRPAVRDEPAPGRSSLPPLPPTIAAPVSIAEPGAAGAPAPEPEPATSAQPAPEVAGVPASEVAREPEPAVAGAPELADAGDPEPGSGVVAEPEPGPDVLAEPEPAEPAPLYTRIPPPPAPRQPPVEYVSPPPPPPYIPRGVGSAPPEPPVESAPAAPHGPEPEPEPVPEVAPRAPEERPRRIPFRQVGIPFRKRPRE